MKKLQKYRHFRGKIGELVPFLSVKSTNNLKAAYLEIICCWSSKSINYTKDLVGEFSANFWIIFQEIGAFSNKLKQQKRVFFVIINRNS